jgi:hypothetical protein
VSAAELIKAPETSAVALYQAVHKLLGDFLAWEPESIWLELEHQGIEVPDPNRAKLMAALTLRLIPGFYWDAIVFEKTAVALAGHFPHPDILEEATPAQLAWAVEEAAWVLRLMNDAAVEFQHEPRAYAGVVLARAGFVLAPSQLEFAQLALHNQTHDGKLRDDVAERWSRASKDHLEQLSLGEDRIDVQIARLAAVELYVRDKRKAAELELTRL